MFEAMSLPFMQLALAASLLVAILGAVLGVQVVLRRIVFVGAALSQISAVGVALAFLVGWDPTPTAFAITLLAVAGFAFVSEGRRLSRESVLGLAYATASAATILLIGNTAHGTDDIMNLLFGNILATSPADLLRIAVAAVLVLGIQFACRRPFMLVGFDPDMARTLGFQPRWWNLAFYLSLGLAVSAVTKVAGSLLTFSFLVIPAMTALVVSKREAGLVRWAVGAAILAAFGGLLLSYRFDLPTGPTMVAVSGVLLLLALGSGMLKHRGKAAPAQPVSSEA